MAAGDLKKLTVLLCIVASQATLIFTFSYEACPLLLVATTTMADDLQMSAAQTTHFHDDTKYVAFFACFASGFVADFLGRRWALVISGVVSSFGLLATSLAPSYGVLIAGRLVSLIGAGLGLPVAPLYVAEMAPPSRRGFLTTVVEIVSVLGLWLAVLTRAAVRDLAATTQWRVMLGMGIIPSLILGVGMTLMPESPCWLVRRARVADAKLVLQRTLKAAEDVETRLLALREAARIPPTRGDENFDAMAQDIRVLAIWQELRRPLVRPHLMKLLVSVLTLHGVQVFSGIDLLTSESLAFPRDKPSFEAIHYLLEQLPPLCGRLFPILVPIFISDVVGRGQLLRYSLAGVASSMVFINVSSTLLKNEVRSRGIKLMYKVSMSAFFGSYSFGLGPVTMIHTTEALPFKVRAQVIGITVMANRLVSFVLYYVKTATDTAVVDVWYWIANAILVSGIWLCTKFVLEKSKDSLEDLDKEFSPTLELSLGTTDSAD